MHAFVQPASCCLLFSPLTNRDPDQGPPPLALRVVRAEEQPRTGLPCRPQQEFHSCHSEGSWNASRQLSSALTELQKPANRLPATASGTVKAGPPTSNTQQPGQDFRKLPALKAVPFRASKAKQGLQVEDAAFREKSTRKLQRPSFACKHRSTCGLSKPISISCWTVLDRVGRVLKKAYKKKWR